MRKWKPKRLLYGAGFKLEANAEGAAIAVPFKAKYIGKGKTIRRKG